MEFSNLVKFTIHASRCSHALDSDIMGDCIVSLFLEGKSPAYIARHLTERGIPTPGGKPNWRPNTVESILTNEKYKGDALLQKTFCTDFLTKKMKANEGGGSPIRYFL